MTTEPLTLQKPVRRMGTTLAAISIVALSFWGLMSLILLISPSALLSTEEITAPTEVREALPDIDSLFLPEGVTMDTTVSELMEKDRSFFESHSEIYRWLSLGWTLFFGAVAAVILRMALSWRREDPFGRGTVIGLRCLGLLLLAQFLAGFVMTALIPSSGYGDLVAYSVMFDGLVSDSGAGASLSCGIVFLTLSWVVEHGLKMKEEQALTI